MPNWCSCGLIVSGNELDVAAFTKEVLSDGSDSQPIFSLDRILPIPSDLRDVVFGRTVIDGEQVSEWRQSLTSDGRLLDAKVDADRLREVYGVTSARGWCQEYWGTQWDTDGSRIVGTREPTKVHVAFETPWTPPIAVLETLADRYESLLFRFGFAEAGVGHIGEWNSNIQDTSFATLDFYDIKDQMVPRVKRHIHEYGIGTGG